MYMHKNIYLVRLICYKEIFSILNVKNRVFIYNSITFFKETEQLMCLTMVPSISSIAGSSDTFKADNMNVKICTFTLKTRAFLLYLLLL
jgi:hypothetical protein